MKKVDTNKSFVNKYEKIIKELYTQLENKDGDSIDQDLIIAEIEETEHQLKKLKLHIGKLKPSVDTEGV